MYNEEIKLRFINEYANDQGLSPIISRFESFCEYESAANKDISQMSVNEVSGIAKDQKIGTYSTALYFQSTVRAYVKWCHENGVFDYVNKDLFHFSTEDIDATDYLKSMWFRDEKDFLEKMRMVRPFDQGYYEVIIMVFAWIGVDQKLIFQITHNDIDFARRRISLRGGAECIQFSKDISEVLYVYENTESGIRPTRWGTVEVFREKLCDSFLTKFSPAKSLGEGVITNAQVGHTVSIMNLAYQDLGFTGSPFKYTNVFTSGALNRVWKLEQTGVDVYSVKNHRLVEAAFGAKIQRNHFLWLYGYYKKIFNL